MVSIPVDVTNIADGEIINANDVLLPLGDLKTAIDDTLNGVQGFDQLNLGGSSEVTISSGSITISRSRHRVDTESNLPSDELDSIVGGSDGDMLRLQLENAARIVVIRHNGGGIGNIRTSDGSSITLSDTNTYVDLLYNSAGSVWIAQTIAPAVSARDLISPTSTKFSVLTFPRNGFGTSGAGTSTGQIFANLTPSWRKRMTRYITVRGSENPAVLSALGCNATITSPGNPSPSSGFSGTTGLHVTCSTGTTPNSRAGIEGSAGAVTFRAVYPLVYAKVRINGTSNFRFLALLTNVLTDDESMVTCCGLRFNPATDTNFMGVARDGTTLQTVDTGVSYVNNGVFEFMFWMDDALATAYYSVNDSAPVSISSNLPASQDGLNFQVTTTTLNNVGKTIEFNRLAIESDG